MGLSGDNIVNVLVDSLSVEELEAALNRKKGLITPRPKPMDENQKIKEYYRRLIVAKGKLYPPQHS